MPRIKQQICRAVIIGLFTVLSSCSSIYYYGQSIAGQIEIFNASKPITTLIRNDQLSESEKSKLQMALTIREFASTELQLPDNNSYRKYADLGRNYVVWNVIATPEFSLTPLQSCFLIVGCLSYKGFFSKKDAIEFGDSLKQKGYDIHIAGVTAYSTLGWFDDPVLNSMIRRNNRSLARVIFHELAHQLIYFENDTEFNEAFAETVAIVGVEKWLKSINEPHTLTEFQAELERENQFASLVSNYKEKLNLLYQNQTDPEYLRKEKELLINQMKKDYQTIQTGWKDHDDYGDWFNSEINNAKLAIVLTYKDLIPDFVRVLDNQGSNLGDFYQYISSLEKCSLPERRVALASPPMAILCDGTPADD